MVDTAQVGVSATDCKAGGDSTAARNVSARVARRGGAVLEDSATGRPSRKSTRKAQGGIKRTGNLQLRAVARTSAPTSRAGHR